MFHRLYTRFRLSDEGASMVEYAILVVLIAIVALLAVAFVGTEVSGMYSDIGGGFPA